MDDCNKHKHKIFKAFKTYINSNVQYTADFYNDATINPWGIISLKEDGNCKKICWVSNTGTNKLCKYFYNGELLEQVTTQGQPTGLIYNKYNNSYKSYKIITVTLAGTIEGLNIDKDNNPSASTEQILFNDSAVYTGVAITKERLYVCNFANGQVEMYDPEFNKIGYLSDDDLVMSGYYPYNVAVKHKTVYVTFARKISENCAVPGIGCGYVDKFTREGQLTYRFISRDPLNAPWGIEFSKCGKYLYIANNGDGKINIFDSCSGEYIGPIVNQNYNIIQIGNIWGISFLSDVLSFASGIDVLPQNCNIGKNGLIGNLQMLK